MPAQYRIILKPSAAKAISEICTFIEKDSPQNASSVASEILAAIDSLDILPHRHKRHQNRRDPALTVRSLPVPPFIVYYRADDARQAVTILTVRHGHRRQPKRFQ